MSLGNWEDQMSVEAESGELPIHHSPFDLRAIGRRIYSFFDAWLREDFFIVFTMLTIMA